MLLIKISSYLPKFFYQHKLILKWQLKTTTSLESLPVVSIIDVSIVSYTSDTIIIYNLLLILPIMLLI